MFLPFNPSSPVYSRVLVNGPLTCATEQYLPAIFTARDDDSVGSIISGSSGTVSGYYGWRMLQIVGGMSGATTLSNLKFLGGYEPLILDDGGTHELRHAQSNGCYSGVYPRYSGTTLLARNLLFHNTLYPFSGSSGSTVRAENITAHKAAYLNPSSSGALNLYLTNSAFISVTNMGG